MKLFGPLVRPAKLIGRHTCGCARARARARVYSIISTAQMVWSVVERRTYIVTIIDLVYSSLARRTRRAVAAARDRYSMRHLAVFRRWRETRGGREREREVRVSIPANYISAKEAVPRLLGQEDCTFLLRQDNPRGSWLLTDEEGFRAVWSLMRAYHEGIGNEGPVYRKCSKLSSP